MWLLGVLKRQQEEEKEQWRMESGDKSREKQQGVRAGLNPTPVSTKRCLIPLHELKACWMLVSRERYWSL